MLCFPAEAADAQRVVGFRYRNLRERAALSQRLGRDVVLQRGVGQTFHKAVAECARVTRNALTVSAVEMCSTMRASVARAWINWPPGASTKAPLEMAGPEFHLLAECSDVD